MSHLPITAYGTSHDEMWTCQSPPSVYSDYGPQSAYCTSLTIISGLLLFVHLALPKHIRQPEVDSLPDLLRLGQRASAEGREMVRCTISS